MSFANHTYETQTLQLASQFITNPYAVLIFVAVFGVCAFILMMAIVPGLFMRETLKEG